MSEIKLLPCPFCGGEARLNHGISLDGIDGWVAECSNYQCIAHSSDSIYYSQDAAIAQWNTRKPMERIIERIENARQKYQRLVREQGEKEDEAMNIHFRGVMQIVKEEGGIE